MSPSFSGPKRALIKRIYGLRAVRFDSQWESFQLFSLISVVIEVGFRGWGFLGGFYRLFRDLGFRVYLNPV